MSGAVQVQLVERWGGHWADGRQSLQARNGGPLDLGDGVLEPWGGVWAAEEVRGLGVGPRWGCQS